MKRGARILLALVAAAALLELVFHVAPGFLPRGYLARFPANGCEFFHPDVLARTPVEGVLLPHRAAAHDGPPPADLSALGIAPRTVHDAQAFPRVRLPADALGFPNAEARERADVVLLGDSFGVAAGALEPEGLQAALARASGLVVHNLSLAGIGPAQERWLLETRALALAPRAVVWLYFAGNDLTESYEPFLARRAGHATWAEAWPERAKPAWILPDLVARLLAPAAPPRVAEPLPPFQLPRADGSTHPLWFLPEALLQLGWSRAEWEAHPVWPAAQHELRAARAACAAAGVSFLVVYLPSKAEVHLAHVVPAPELVHRTVTALGAPVPPLAPPELLARLLANRDAHEELLRDFCAREAIPFLSAVPALEALAARGELGYLVTDTHWQARGQAALLAPLLAHFRREGLLD